ncbi:hypothetical protein PFISCL1PPCAC_15770, partial [Pristionchus fissidentatus]
QLAHLMSGAPNGPPKLGFPQAPVGTQNYQPMSQFSQYGAPQQQSMALSAASSFRPVANGMPGQNHVSAPPPPSSFPGPAMVPAPYHPLPGGISQPMANMSIGPSPIARHPAAFPSFSTPSHSSSFPGPPQQSTVSQVQYPPVSRPSPFPGGSPAHPSPLPSGGLLPPAPSPMVPSFPPAPGMPPASSQPVFPPSGARAAPGMLPPLPTQPVMPPGPQSMPHSMQAGQYPQQSMYPTPAPPAPGPPSAAPGYHAAAAAPSYPTQSHPGGYPGQQPGYPEQQPGYPGRVPSGTSLTNHIDLSVERSPMGGGMEEISYPLPSNNGLDVRCDPSIFRSTLNAVPQTEDLLHKSRLPFGLTLHPFRDVKQLNVIRANTIVRCRYCRTYINPFVFLPDARRWKCNLCYKANDLPEDFCYDSTTKSFTEPTRRPEMQHATVEFIAPSEYMLRPPQPPVYMFIFDVSTPAIQSGYLRTMSEQFVMSLDQMPGDERTLMSFVAVDSALHFFQFHTPGKLPRELVVDEVDDMFLPSNTGLLVKVKTFKESIRNFLSRLPDIFSSPSSSSSSNALGSALNVAKEMISELGGRVTIFQCSLPTVGMGALKMREDPNKRAAGDCDVTPASDHYKKLALDCTAVQMGIDLFTFSREYVDLATLSEVSKFSSGTVYRFPGYQVDENIVETRRFEKVFTRYLTRKIGFEAVLRIRCSRGIGISSFFGNFFVRSTDLLSMANVNPDSAVGVQLNLEEKIGSSTVCFQAALLYTSSKGDRRIRVHTLSLPTTSELSTLFNNVDLKATVSLLAKMGVDRACQGAALADCREAIVNASVDGLGAFAKTAGRTGVLAPKGGQLRYLPLLSLSMLKNSAFVSGRSVKLDDRVMAMCSMRSANTDHIFTEMYPLIYRLNDLPQLDESAEPRPLPASFEYIERDGVYLMISGHWVLLYVAASSDPIFVDQLFGVKYHQLDPLSFRETSSPVSQRCHSFVTSLIQRNQIHNAPLVIREDSSLRELFVSKFVEDRSESSHSYVEFINHIKKEIGH